MCPYMQIEEILMVLEEVFVIVGLKAQRAKEFARNLKAPPIIGNALMFLLKNMNQMIYIKN